jgi:hypothetical protein
LVADIQDPSPGEKALPDLELRQARQARVVSALAESRQRYGQIYLIERQAIELRRLRLSKGPKEAQRAKVPSPDTRFDRPGRATAPSASKPSPQEAFAPYERPRPDSSQSRVAEGFLARTAAWLRQTLLGE